MNKLDKICEVVMSVLAIPIIVLVLCGLLIAFTMAIDILTDVNIINEYIKPALRELLNV